VSNSGKPRAGAPPATGFQGDLRAGTLGVREDHRAPIVIVAAVGLDEQQIDAAAQQRGRRATEQMRGPGIDVDDAPR